MVDEQTPSTRMSPPPRSKLASKPLPVPPAPPLPVVPPPLFPAMPDVPPVPAGSVGLMPAWLQPSSSAVTPRQASDVLVIELLEDDGAARELEIDRLAVRIAPGRARR